METYWLEQTEADPPVHNDWLSADEAILLSHLRFAKRRADWRLGRWTAKHAAAACLNLPGDPRFLREIEVRPAPSGAPQVFVRNRFAAVTISISHRAGVAVCAIVMGGAQLGCDLELIEPRDESFVADYFTGEEQELISRAPRDDQPRLVTLLWSAKESALKALRQGLRVDTRCVAVTFDAPTDYEHAAGGPGQYSELDRWRPLQVRYAGGDILHGWWQSTGLLVRTLVGSPSPLPPLRLKGCAAPDHSADLVTI
ncbi:MAG: 4'-phosphopantetheinyl transferase superfamily protein [Terriglobales bacterium]